MSHRFKVRVVLEGEQNGWNTSAYSVTSQVAQMATEFAELGLENHRLRKAMALAYAAIKAALEANAKP